MSTSSVNNNKAGFEKLHQEAEVEKKNKSAKQDQKIATTAAVGQGLQTAGSALAGVPILGGVLQGIGGALQVGAAGAAAVKKGKEGDTTGAVMASVGAVGAIANSAKGVNNHNRAAPNSPGAQATVVAQSETQPKAKS